MVSIDGRSLAELDVWPWPRGYHATVLENLLEAGADRVAFDLEFSSRSDPDEDRTFAAALEESGGRVILPVKLCLPRSGLRPETSAHDK